MLWEYYMHEPYPKRIKDLFDSHDLINIETGKTLDCIAMSV
jgi:hypothetical protein